MPMTFTPKPTATANQQGSKPQPNQAAPETPPANGGGTEPPKSRSEPTLPLPTDRINFDNQLKLLRAYASASDKGAKAVSNEDVAGIVEMKASTVSLANNFFVKNGFLVRTGREYTPAKEVLEYKLAHEWDATTAASKLGPLVERSWFGAALKPKLDLRPMEENEAIADLAQRANSGPEYRNQIKTLIDYMCVSGMVSRDGNILTLVRRQPDQAPPDTSEEKPAPAAPMPTAADVPQSDLSALPFGQVGSVKFAVSINVDMTQMAQWEPQRISAFFTGLAQVISAQKGGKQP